MTTPHDHDGREVVSRSGEATPVLATTSMEEEAAATPGAAMMAAIEGVLTLNAKGCFEVDGYILVAPSGSYATQDPVGIYLPEVGVIPAGSTIYSAGAYVDRLVSGPRDEEVTTWDTFVTSSTRGFAVLQEQVTHRA